MFWFIGRLVTKSNLCTPWIGLGIIQWNHAPFGTSPPRVRVLGGISHTFVMDCQHTLESQLLANVKDYIKLCLGSLKGMTDEKRKLFAFVLTIVIGGNNIDWKIPQSVASVCDILGVGKTTVYEYRNATTMDYKPPKRQRRSDALKEQVWWPQASCVMDTFWESNCDESPNADDPAEKHDFTSPANHTFVPLEDNPEKKRRVCVGTYLFMHVVTICWVALTDARVFLVW